MSNEPLTKGLMEPFPREAIKQRQGGGGKMLDYVSGSTVRRRLFAVLDNKYDFEIIKMESSPWGTRTNRQGKSEDQWLVMVHGRLTIDGLGSRDGVGVQIVSISSGEDLFKGAKTDALKNAAMEFGVAIDLYGEDLEATAREGTARLGRPPSTRTKLTSLLKAQGITSKTAANKASKEKFGKEIDVLDDADVAAWVKELEASEPVPF